MKQIDLCFIGAGFQASMNIYPAVIAAGVNIKAIATRSMDNSRKALIKFGSEGTPYDDYKEMLDKEDCDGVVIVAQPKDQYLIALECLKMGKNVFVEKPMGWNEKEAGTLHEVAKDNGVFAMVGFMKRYAPCYKKVKDIISSKELGEARSFAVNFAVDGTPFCKDEESFLKLAAIHIVDLVRYLFGEVVEIQGFSNSINENVTQCFSMKFESGVVGSFYFSSMTAWSRESENLTVTFDDGFAQTKEINKVIIHRSKKNDEIPYATQTEEDSIYTPSMTPMSGGLRDLYLRGFVGEIEHFSRCLEENAAPSSNDGDNIKTMMLCDRILDALK